MNRTITITKRRGAVLDRSAVHRWVDAVLDTMPNGMRELVFRKQERRRSNDQNRLMWLWFTCIENETGQDRNDVHDHYCRKYLSRHIDWRGEEEQVTIGTSGLNTETMTYFLNRVQTDAASELGIRLPSPEDEAWAEFEEYYKNRI